MEALRWTAPDSTFADRMGQATAADGLSPIAGRLFATLLLSDEPRSLDALAERARRQQSQRQHRRSPPVRARHRRTRHAPRRSSRLLRARAGLLRAGHSQPRGAVAPHSEPRSARCGSASQDLPPRRARSAFASIDEIHSSVIDRIDQRAQRLGARAHARRSPAREAGTAPAVGVRRPRRQPARRRATTPPRRIALSPDHPHGAVERARRAERASDRGDPHKYIIAFAVVLAALMQVIDSSIVNVALPDMMGNLGASLDEIAWVSTGYILASVIIIPLTGWLGSFFGRKRYFVGSIILFTASSFLCGAVALARRAHLLARRAGTWRRRADDGVAGRAVRSVPARRSGHGDGAVRARRHGRARRSARRSAAGSPTTTAGRGSSTSTCRVGILAAVMIAAYVHDSAPPAEAAGDRLSGHRAARRERRRAAVRARARPARRLVRLAPRSSG